MWNMSRSIGVWIVYLMVASLFLSMVALQQGSDPSVNAVTDPGSPITRSPITPDFDVQFLMEPSTDRLDPLFGEKYAYVESGSLARYWVMITNIGDHNDTYYLDLNEPPEDSGINWYFADGGGLQQKLNLSSPEQRDLHGGISFKVFLIEVQAARYLWIDHIFSLEVSAISLMNIEMYGFDAPTDSDTILIHGVNEPDWIVWPPIWKETIFHVDPGKWIELPFKLANLGNRKVIDVNLKVCEDDLVSYSYRDFEDLYSRTEYNLEYNWTRAHFTIEQGKQVFRNISARIPEDYDGMDDVFQFTVVVVFNDPRWVRISDVVTLIVNRQTDLKASLVEDGPFPIGPGENITVALKITNTMEDPDIIEDVRILDPRAIGFRALNETMEPITGLEVPGMGYSTFNLEFLADPYITPGPLDVDVKVFPKYSDPLIVRVRLQVRDEVDMRLLPTDPVVSGRARILPGESLEFVFGIRNDGNSLNNVTVGSFLDIPPGVPPSSYDEKDNWTVRTAWISQVREPSIFVDVGLSTPWDDSVMEDDKGYRVADLMEGGGQVGLDPGETIWIAFDITSPDLNGWRWAPPILMTTFLIAANGSTLDSFDLRIDVAYPDLVFDWAPILTDRYGSNKGSFEANEEVLLTFKVSNIGSMYSDATVVRIVSKDKILGEVVIDPLAPGEKDTYVWSFEAAEWMERIDLELDPENAVIESDDQFVVGSDVGANTIGSPITVDGTNGSGTAKWIVLGTLVILLILGILAYLSILKRSRRDR